MASFTYSVPFPITPPPGSSTPPIPPYYCNNSTLSKGDTIYVSGNRVTNCSYIGLSVQNCTNIRMKNNQVSNMLGTAIGFYLKDNVDILLVYNTASRIETGFQIDSAGSTVNFYNITVHNCKY